MYYMINIGTSIYCTKFHNHPENLRTVECLFIRLPCLVFDHGRGRWAANRCRAMAWIRQHAMSLSYFLGFMLRANGGRMWRVLSGMGVVPITHDKDKNNGNKGGLGVTIKKRTTRTVMMRSGKANHCHRICCVRYVPLCP